MKTFLITYDLRGATVDNYTRLHDRIQTLIYWARPLESVWIIKSQLFSNQIRDYLTPFVVPGGRLFVAEITPQTWAGWGLDQNVVNWFNANNV